VIKIMDGPMDAVERVILAKKERVSAWLLTGYKTLVGGPEILTMDRIKKLDWETIAKLLAIQHRLLVRGQITVPCSECTRRGRRSSGPFVNQGPAKAEAMLEEEFQNELHHIREEEYEKGWKVRLPPVEDQAIRKEQCHQEVGTPLYYDDDD
jgi:hypothetical protein